MSGSPAALYNIPNRNFIMAINDISTPDIESFVREVSKVKDNTYFRLKLITFDNVPRVATMKKCEHYFPTIKSRPYIEMTPFCRRIQ